MLVKVHNSYRETIAICDSDLIGKTFQEGQKQLIITENFFRGEEKSESEVMNIIESGSSEDCTFNIVGKQAVGLALKSGIIKPEGIIKIQDIPVALVLL